MEAGKIRAGHKLLIDGQPYTVVDYMLRQQPRMVAKMITKLRNLLTGSTIEKTFVSSDTVEEADVSKAKAQYLYNDGENYVFMDNDTYEQFEFTKNKLGETVDYLKDNIEVSIMKFNDNPINVELPPTITLKVINTEPGVKGNTAAGGSKPATLETGVVVNVPFFINVGDLLLINTQTGEYKERAKQ